MFTDYPGLEHFFAVQLDDVLHADLGVPDSAPERRKLEGMILAYMAKTCIVEAGNLISPLSAEQAVIQGIGWFIRRQSIRDDERATTSDGYQTLHCRLEDVPVNVVYKVELDGEPDAEGRVLITASRKVESSLPDNEQPEYGLDELDKPHPEVFGDFSELIGAGTKALSQYN